MRLFLAALLAAFVGFTLPHAVAAEFGPPPVPIAEAELTVGDPAPPLDVTAWVTQRSEDAEPVTAFEPGQVYVVEFWATWCGPCIVNIPHLGDLADEFDGRVRFLSVSSEEVDTVEKFLDGSSRFARPEAADADTSGENEVKNDLPPTLSYRELASRYDVGVDPDRSVSTGYMQAAFESGIPNAFIVGRDGRVEWVGHPAELDGPLAAVVAGSWDREPFAAEYAAAQAETAIEMTSRALLSADRIDDAIALADWIIASAESPQGAVAARRQKVSILSETGRFEEAERAIEDLVASFDGEDKTDENARIGFVSWASLAIARVSLTPPGDAETAAAVDRVIEKMTAVEGVDPRFAEQIAIRFTWMLASNAAEAAEPRATLKKSLAKLGALVPADGRSRAQFDAALNLLDPPAEEAASEDPEAT